MGFQGKIFLNSHGLYKTFGNKNIKDFSIEKKRIPQKLYFVIFIANRHQGCGCLHNNFENSDPQFLKDFSERVHPGSGIWRKFFSNGTSFFTSSLSFKEILASC